jgi:hypothetical protein
MFCELTIVLWALGQDNGGVPAEFRRSSSEPQRVQGLKVLSWRWQQRYEQRSSHSRADKVPTQAFRNRKGSKEGAIFIRKIKVVPLAGIEPALLAELDFESSASTNSATGARRCDLPCRVKAGQ